ncbi:hypothetical protein [Acidovorax carolinensis]|nr:hypothetical protein [Acidovorax carolinensis]
MSAGDIICGAYGAVASLDLNAIMDAAGEGASVVDALVERASAPGDIR